MEDETRIYEDVGYNMIQRRNSTESLSSMVYNQIYTNVNTTVAQRPSNEYHVLQRNTNNIQKNNATGYHVLQRNMSNKLEKANSEQNEPKRVEHHDLQAPVRKMKIILIITVFLNLVMLLLVATVAIALPMLSYSYSISGESEIDDYDLLNFKLSQLATEIQENTSQVVIHLQADIITVQAELAIANSNITQILTRLDSANSNIASIQSQAANLQTQLHCGPGQWHRVAYLNMSETSQQCPFPWREYNTSGVRACGRPVSHGESCAAVSYSISHQYSGVCGRVTGYQVASPDGFRNAGDSIDQSYMDGISITHGHSRVHIWSYVAGVTQSSSQHTHNNCPCSSLAGNGHQSFVGNNYYCESGNPNDDWESHLYSNDKLWDGQQCEGTCCKNNKFPPWFSVQLPVPTNDAIEVRICGDESTSNEDTPVELVEIFVQLL